MAIILKTLLQHINMEQVFTYIYENNIWGNNLNSQYSGSSGDGSTIEFNKDTYVNFVQNFIKDYGIKSVVDLGCGDFRCGSLIYDELNVKYTGYDVYKKVVDFNTSKHSNNTKYNFIHLDFMNEKEQIIESDLCILKDVIQHWCLRDIYTFFDYITNTKKFKYILLCNCGHQKIDNTDIYNGNYRPLSCKFLPLKKYDPVKLYEYNGKEVSLITPQN